MINVRDLVENADLSLEFYGGADGGDRLVTWAHTIELDDPWRWVSSGDLVMTTGAGLPPGGREQAAWIDRLVEARASALVVAPRPGAPALSRAMASRADQMRFPLIGASFDLRFSELARVVIGSSLQTQRDRLEASQRLFESYATALRGGTDFAERLEALGRRLSWHIEVADSHTDERIAASFTRRPAVEEAVELPVPGRTAVALRVWPRDRDEVIDPLQVHYLTGLVGIELENQAIECDQRREEGSSLLVGLLDGTLDLVAARAYLRARGLAPEQSVVVATNPGVGGDRTLDDVHVATPLRSISTVMHIDGDALIAVLPADLALIGALTKTLGEGASSGVSTVIGATGSFATVLYEARLALRQARASGKSVVEYALVEDREVLTPWSVPAAERIVERHLGPLLEYDARRRSQLLPTLRAFLAADGNWGETASALHIHRQTLVYRLRRVEELTGLKPTSTAGTARFWLALEAGRAAGLLE